MAVSPTNGTARTIQEFLEKARIHKISLDDAMELIDRSNLVQGSAHVKSRGHPLDHCKILMEFKQDFLSAGGKLHARVHQSAAQAEETPLTQAMVRNTMPNNTAKKHEHSEFTSDFELAHLVACALNGPGGQWALKQLASRPNAVIELIAATGETFTDFEKTSDKSVKPPQFAPRQSDLVTLLLHPRPSGELHLQSAYGVPKEALGEKANPQGGEPIPLLFRAQVKEFNDRSEVAKTETVEG